MADSAEPADGTLPDVDLSPGDLVRLHPEGARPEREEDNRPGWISSILRGDQAERELLPLEPGFVVPGTRYKLVAWLGDGGMGVVYEAEHIDLERKVALKIIREKYCRDPQLKEMFRSEARAASRVGAENIVQIYDFAELPDGRLAFAMELLRGRLLKQHVKDGVFTAERAVGVLRQVCKGLAAAHDAQVVHRDIKPANIVLETIKGRADTVKILDFGIATIMVESGSAHDRGGTPLYVAPELVTGLPADERSDIYSLGCTAFELLAGHPPFQGESAKEILLAHLDAPPPDLGALRSDLPGPLVEVVARCLAKEPTDRYADMRDLEAALCEAQIESGLHTAWDDLPLPEVTPERRDRLARRMPQPARPGATGRRTRILALAGLAAIGGIAVVVATRPEPEVRDAVEELTLAARAAAAEAYWVYPPPDEPTHPTAYTRVLELESLDGRGAGAAAEMLRAEFAGTLGRLGDEYWERPGGKPFAIDYYAQVLVFEPDHDVASERARLSPGQLAILQEKAEAGTFSREELIAVEPLQALAEPDQKRRARKLDVLAEREVAASTGAQLERLLGQPVVARTQRPSGQAPPSPPQSTDHGDTSPEPTAPEVEASGTETPTSAPDEHPDRERARELARAGEASLADGRAPQALELFEQALAADPRNAEALAGVARVNFERGNYERSVRFARKAVQIAPRNSGYRIQLGDAYYKAFRYDDARREYDVAAQLGHRDAAGRLAKVQQKLGG